MEITSKNLCEEVQNEIATGPEKTDKGVKSALVLENVSSEMYNYQTRHMMASQFHD